MWVGFLRLNCKYSVNFCPKRVSNPDFHSYTSGKHSLKPKKSVEYIVERFSYKEGLRLKSACKDFVNIGKEGCFLPVPALYQVRGSFFFLHNN